MSVLRSMNSICFFFCLNFRRRTFSTAELSSASIYNKSCGLRHKLLLLLWNTLFHQQTSCFWKNRLRRRKTFRPGNNSKLCGMGLKLSFFSLDPFFEQSIVFFHRLTLFKAEKNLTVAVECVVLFKTLLKPSERPEKIPLVIENPIIYQICDQ